MSRTKGSGFTYILSYLALLAIFNLIRPIYAYTCPQDDGAEYTTWVPSTPALQVSPSLTLIIAMSGSSSYTATGARPQSKHILDRYVPRSMAVPTCAPKIQDA